MTKDELVHKWRPRIDEAKAHMPGSDAWFDELLNDMAQLPEDMPQPAASPKAASPRPESGRRP